MSTVLEVKNLSKNYPSFQLEDVSFSLKENSITGFIGINGAGKTTTIKAILGLVLKDAGYINLFGKDMDKYEREVKNRIGVVFDEGYFYEDLTLSDMKSIIAPSYSSWNEAEFLRNISRFNLSLKQKIATLSKGMRMKFALSLALSHNADLLIMDEPTSGLDPLVRNELMEILLEFIRDKGKSIFFSSHITSDLEKVADTMILINKGKIVFHEEKNVLLDTHVLVKGDSSLLTDEVRGLFLSIKEELGTFTGLVKMREETRQQLKGVIFEKATIESIMLAYIGGVD